MLSRHYELLFHLVKVIRVGVAMRLLLGVISLFVQDKAIALASVQVVICSSRSDASQVKVVKGTHLRRPLFLLGYRHEVHLYRRGPIGDIRGVLAITAKVLLSATAIALVSIGGVLGRLAQYLLAHHSFVPLGPPLDAVVSCTVSQEAMLALFAIQ